MSIGGPSEDHQESSRNLSGICQESIRSPAQSIETLSGVPQESIGNPSGSYQGVNIFSQVSYTPSRGLSEGLSGAPSEAPFGCPSGVCRGSFGVSVSANDLFK